MNDFYMQLAINEAWKYQFLTYPNPAVGCVILDKNGKILSISAHKKAGLEHAELNAIKHALKALNNEFDFPKDVNDLYDFIIKNHNDLLRDAIAYVSLEPCAHHGKTPPCARLFTSLKFKKVFISIKDENKIASGGAEFLRKNGVLIELDVLKNEGLKLIKPFLKWQKQEKFKIFKLALSLNGSAYGKIISSIESRTYAHKIRSVIDCLIIGGNTIRIDRPILDARLANDKAPNICILSKNKNFDTNIPLFSVKNREIFYEIPKEAKFLMYEGGNNFLKEFKDEMDMFLIFSNSKFDNNENVKINLNLKPLYKGFLGEDTYGIYEL